MKQCEAIAKELANAKQCGVYEPELSRFWPDPSQFVFVDGAIAELVGFKPQLTPD